MPVVLILALVLALVGCKDESGQEADQKAAEEVQKKEQLIQELQQKEQLIQSLSDERKARLRTLRLLGFIVLSGGSVAVLVWANRPSAFVNRPSGNEGHTPMIQPQWQDVRHLPNRGRIIEIPRTQAPHPQHRPRQNKL